MAAADGVVPREGYRRTEGENGDGKGDSNADLERHRHITDSPEQLLLEDDNV